jgi:MFS family permease
MEQQDTPLINQNLRWFLLAMVLANIAAQMAYSMLSLYLIDLGASVGQIGLVFTVASLAPMALQIFGGWFSDTVGRLRAIAMGSLISVFGYMLFVASPSWQWVMFGLSVEYISSAFVGPSFGAYIAEQSDEASRGRIYGITSGIYMVVTVIGPGLAGMIAYRQNFRLMLVVAFAFYALATVIRVWMALSDHFKPERAPEKPTWSGLKTQLKAMFSLLFAGGILTWIWVSDAISDTSYKLIGELFPIYLSDIGRLTVEEIGWLASAWGVASILGSFISGWLTDKHSERTVLTGGFLLITLGLVSMMLARSPLGFLLSRLLSGLGIGVLIPAYNSLISKVVPEDNRGLAFGFFGTSLSLLSLPMPWIGAQLWERFTPQTPFWITAMASAIIVPVVWAKFVLPERQEVASGQRSKC